MKKKYIKPTSKLIILTEETPVMVNSGIMENDVMTRKTDVDNGSKTIWGNWDDSDE